MGETEGELQHLAGGARAVTYAYEFHFFAVTFADAYHHIVDERAVETVLCAVLAVVAGTAQLNVAVFDFNVEFGVHCLREGALGTLDRNHIVLDIDAYACGNGDGCFTYT